jgi:hypothetical protein
VLTSPEVEQIMKAKRPTLQRIFADPESGLDKFYYTTGSVRCLPPAPRQVGAAQRRLP